MDATLPRHTTNYSNLELLQNSTSTPTQLGARRGFFSLPFSPSPFSPPPPPMGHSREFSNSKFPVKLFTNCFFFFFFNNFHFHFPFNPKAVYKHKNTKSGKAGRFGAGGHKNKLLRELRWIPFAPVLQTIQKKKRVGNPAVRGARFVATQVINGTTGKPVPFCKNWLMVLCPRSFPGKLPGRGTGDLLSFETQKKKPRYNIIMGIGDFPTNSCASTNKTPGLSVRCGFRTVR